MQLKKIFALAVLALSATCALAQSGAGSGILYATDFNAWTLPQANTPTAGLIQWPSAAMCHISSNGYSFVAVKVGRPLTIVDVDPTLTETVTPVSVITSGGSCSVTATMAHTHLSYHVQSGTAGMQEAIDYSASQTGGSSVWLTPGWTTAGGLSGMITAAYGQSTTSILDARVASLCSYGWNGSAYVATGCGTNSASLTAVTLQTFAGPLAIPGGITGPLSIPGGLTGTNATLSSYVAGINLPYNVVTAGADPTGGTDSTTAIQSALTAHGTAGVCFPAGTYKVTALTAINDLVMSACAGMSYPIGGGAVGYAGQVQIASNSATPLLTISGKQRVTLSNVRLINSGGLALNAVESVGIIAFNTEFDGAAATGAVVVQNGFEFRCQFCTFSIPSTVGAHSVRLIGATDALQAVSSSYLFSMRDSFLLGGGVAYDQNVAALVPVAGFLFDNVVMESSYTPMLEAGSASAWTSDWAIFGVTIRDSYAWDSLGVNVPLVKTSNAHAAVNGLLIDNAVSLGSSYQCLQSAGLISSAIIRNTSNSAASVTACVDGNGNPVTSEAHRLNGTDFVGASAGTSSSLPFAEGPTVRICNAGEANCRLGITNTGVVQAGPGSSTGGWDTDLSRLQAGWWQGSGFYVDNNGKPAMAVNSAGTLFGTWGSPSANLFCLGSATALTAFTNQALCWDNLGNLQNATGTILPAGLTGFHGSAGTKVQLSDGTGSSGNCAKFAADGSMTDAGAPCGTGSPGVASIDTQTGAFTFAGAGVSHVGNAYTFSGTGSGVTSVALTTPSWLTVSGSPITTSGTLAVTATGAQTANQFLATPNGSAGAVGLRALVNADLPSQNQVRTCSVGFGDGLNAVPAGTYPVNFQCRNLYGVTYTITGIQCASDNNGTSTVNASDSASNALLTGAITTTTTWAAGTQSAHTTIGTNVWTTWTIVADGTSKQIQCVMAGTI